jgi:hypothetical protein
MTALPSAFETVRLLLRPVTVQDVDVALGQKSIGFRFCIEEANFLIWRVNRLPAS